MVHASSAVLAARLLWVIPLSLQVLGSNLVLEDLQLALTLSLVKQRQSEALLQLQCLASQRHNLIHLCCNHIL